MRVGRHRKLDLSQQRRAHALRQRSDVLVGGGHRGIDAIGNPAGNANHPEPDERPLDLAVHSQPQLLALADAPVQRMGRYKMLLILLVCAAPVVASYLTYYLVRPDMRRHFGELIEPQRPLPDQLVTRLDGTVINLRSLKGQWLLTSVAAGQCDDGCQRNLYLQRQLRESLGKDKEWVDWVWIISNATEPSAAIRAALGPATVLRVPLLPLSQWLQPAAGSAIHERLYLVDPMGNLMMRFPANMDVAGSGRAKRDLGRLLRASASWDLAGR